MRSRGARSVVFRRIRRASFFAIAGLATWALATIVGLIPPLLVPPAILPGGRKELQLDDSRFPEGTERVELVTPGGETLRGVYVPADQGAPVVLHLLESSGSVTVAWSGYQRTFRELADLGFASLMVDYRGVGASDGDRSPRHLADDASVLWQEAVRRAGGDPARVVVRGLSIGTLAAASLADRGSRPAAWILISPVRGETVFEHFLASRTRPGLARMVASLFRPVTETDLLDSVGGMGPRLFVASSEEDFLLSRTEQVRLEIAVRQSGGAWSSDGSYHAALTLEAHSSVLPEEVDLLRAVFPDWPDRGARASEMLDGLPSELVGRFSIGSEPRSRLEELVRSNRSAPATAIAALALSVQDSALAARLARHVRRESWLRNLEFGDAVATLDMEDPAGGLPWTLLEAWLRVSDAGMFLPPTSVESSPRGTYFKGVDGAVEFARISEAEAASGRLESHVLHYLGTSEALHYPCCDTWRELLVDRQLKRADARRQVVRLVLKAMSIPDRLQVSAEGDLELQAREGDGWRTVSLDWPEPIDSAAHPGDARSQSR